MDACRVHGPTGETRLPLGEGGTGWPERLTEALPAGAKVRARVADAHLRYLVLHWPAAVRSRDERALWLGHQFHQVHDIDPAQWQIAVDEDAVGLPFIACAMPRALIDSLRSRLGRHRLAGLTGAFVDTYNRHGAQIRAADGALARMDDGRLTLGVWRDGQWTRLLSRPVDMADTTVVARELVQLQVTGEAAPVGTLYRIGAPVEAPAGWHLDTLEAR